jgi:hypothetical protein
LVSRILQPLQGLMPCGVGYRRGLFRVLGKRSRVLPHEGCEIGRLCRFSSGFHGPRSRDRFQFSRPHHDAVCIDTVVHMKPDRLLVRTSQNKENTQK